jgi:hypothetical protein
MTKRQNHLITKWSRLIATAIVPTAGLKLAVNQIDETVTGDKDDKAAQSMRLINTLKRAAIKLNPAVQEQGIKV